MQIRVSERKSHLFNSPIYRYIENFLFYLDRWINFVILFFTNYSVRFLKAKGLSTDECMGEKCFERCFHQTTGDHFE